MPDYRELYFDLATKTSDAISLLIAALEQRGESDPIPDLSAPLTPNPRSGD